MPTCSSFLPFWRSVHRDGSHQGAQLVPLQPAVASPCGRLLSRIAVPRGEACLTWAWRFLMILFHSVSSRSVLPFRCGWGPRTVQENPFQFLSTTLSCGVSLFSAQLSYAHKGQAGQWSPEPRFDLLSPARFGANHDLSEPQFPHLGK